MMTKRDGRMNSATIMARRMIKRVRADGTDGPIVELRARWAKRRAPVATSESGDGSNASNKRRIDRSDNVPYLPPNGLIGAVFPRHGTPTRKRGRPAASPTMEPNAASLRAVRTVSTPIWASFGASTASWLRLWRVTNLRMGISENEPKKDGNPDGRRLW
jgi:hypothetical protein